MDSPAAQAALHVEAIKKIPLPTIETFEPPQLTAAAAAYAIAVRKVQEAEKVIAKIKAEQIEREKRIAFLQAELAKVSEVIIDIWCANYRELPAETDVRTMEVPGFWIDEPTSKLVTLYEGTEKEKTVSYDERSINIAPNGSSYSPQGDLVPAEAMSDAAIYYNLAMEAGHNKWGPQWRYGILLTEEEYHAATDQCTVKLNDAESRSGSDLGALDINGFGNGGVLGYGDDDILIGVPISYPTCNGKAFKKNDEVLVYFAGDRETPIVIGFRRKPVQCPGNWIQRV